MKKIISLLLAAAMLCASAALSSCSGEKKETQPTTAAQTEAKKTGVSPAVDDLAKTVDLSDADLDPKITYAKNEKYGFQLDKPNKGDTIAVIHTTKGDITLRFFPEYAPKTVENFISLAKEGKYDNVIFHRVINNFMIQTGDYENQNGTGGKSAFGSAFEDEFCDKLNNIRGSVSMANSGKDTNGSQFFINQAPKSAFPGFEKYESNWTNIKSQIKQYGADALSYFGTSCYDPDVVPEQIKTLYEENGGNPTLDGAYNAADAGHTVFAQVIDGMKVVDKIAKTKTDGSDKPKKDIKIKSIDITKYKG